MLNLSFLFFVKREIYPTIRVLELPKCRNEFDKEHISVYIVVWSASNPQCWFSSLVNVRFNDGSLFQEILNAFKLGMRAYFYVVHYEML